MYLFRFLNRPLGGGGAATQTFALGGKYPRATTVTASIQMHTQFPYSGYCNCNDIPITTAFH